MEATERLTASPGSGRIVPELDRPNIREILFGEYRIVYRLQAEEATILLMSHGRRVLDIDSLREQESP